MKLEYLYAQFGKADVRFPSGAQYNSTLDFQQIRIGLNRKVDWPGSKAGHRRRPDRYRIRSLGNPWPDHLSGSGLSGIPRALYRHQQPDPGAAVSGHLEQQPLSERPALGRRRGLLQSRTAAGLRFERHCRYRRIFQRRGAEVELPLPALQHLAAVCAPDLRVRRRAGGACQRAAAASGKVDVNRLTLQAGKFSVGDIFDGNAYAKDTRKDFINWSIWAPGAFDYAADKLGLTYGMTVGEPELVGGIVEGAGRPDRPVDEILAGVLGVSVAVKDVADQDCRPAASAC